MQQHGVDRSVVAEKLNGMSVGGIQALAAATSESLMHHGGHGRPLAVASTAG